MASEGCGDETVSSLCSPRNRVKFLCSYGGKILPRAVDGHLKYVGGETRVVAISRDINFSELMKKLRTVYDGDMVLKYQLIPEDLDSLVSVRTDEDVKHMLEEYDRHESDGTLRLRAFLFPSTPVVVDNLTAPIDPLAFEQRYIDAINGIVRTTGSGRLTPIKASRSSFSISSACSSPKSNSPDSMGVDSFPHDFVVMDGYQNSRLSMHKVQSSPSLCNLASSHHQSSGASNHHFYQHPHHYYSNHHHHHPPPSHSYQSHRSPPLSLAQAADYFRNPMAHSQSLYQSRSYSASRNFLGLGSHNKYGCFDEPVHEPVYVCRRPERAGSLPQSPKKSNAQ